VDDHGCFTHTSDLPADQQMPASLLGKAILPRHGKSEANEAVLDLLRERKALAHQTDYTHSYPHCWRSKTPVIFRAMDQWFVRIDHRRHGPDGPTFRDEALGEIGRVQWIPDWGRSRIEGAVKSRPDWCISRQRTWGVPIPVFYDAAGAAILDARVVRKTADLFERTGSNAWFELPLADLWAAVRPEGWDGAEPASKSTDTLDVWIDSGSSSRCVLQARPELRGTPAAEPSAPPSWQADLYLEGSDQHRGWFQSSLLLSLGANGCAPFRTVLTHGFMVDADREKISKSKQGQGGYQKPQTCEAYIQKWGADVMRLWVASQDFRGDVVVGEERINKVGEAYRVIRNALRYQLSNLYDFDPARDGVPDAELTDLDRWVLGEFAQLESAVLEAYERCEFHVIFQRTSQFAAVELSAVYHDVVKDRLYTDPAGSRRRRSTQTALWRLVSGLCRMLSPILAFTADEAWEHIPGRPVPSVHLASWEPAPWTPRDGEAETWKSLFALREQSLPELEKARQAKLIGKSLEAAVTVSGAPVAAATGHAEALRELLNVSQLHLGHTTGEDLQVQVGRATGAKCERCWHWETTVGASAAHAGLCDRCLGAVGTTG
jgi:isoleucyl-tRNA synthetase